jgi:hypothetical protein
VKIFEVTRKNVINLQLVVVVVVVVVVFHLDLEINKSGALELAQALGTSVP